MFNAATTLPVPTLSTTLATWLLHHSALGVFVYPRSTTNTPAYMDGQHDKHILHHRVSRYYLLHL